MRIIAILFLALTLSACSKQPETAKSADTKPAQPSTAQTAVEGLTGYTAVKQGKKAQQQIKDINAKQNEQLDEVLK